MPRKANEIPKEVIIKYWGWKAKLYGSNPPPVREDDRKNEPNKRQ